MVILWVVISLLVITALIIATPWWISIYNKFQYWSTRAQCQFADINTVMQERLDNIYALAEIVKRYNIHEYSTLKDIIEARGILIKDIPVTELAKFLPNIDASATKLQALFEKYPELKADTLHVSLMERDSELEKGLRQTRLAFNYSVQQFNMRTRRFPENIVASAHDFTELSFLTFPQQEVFKLR